MRVLIADDDLISRRLLRNSVERRGYEAVEARDGVEAWEILSQPDRPPIAILDWMMPGMDGPAVCRAVRKSAAERYTYLVLLTSRGDKEDVVEGLDAGADDYLVKPFNALELEARLRAGVRILDLQARLLSIQEELSHQATHDPLTGLWNRAAVLDHLDRELARVKRQHGSCGVILADLDRFKQINDTHGHLAGDAALREVAASFRASLRPYDIVGRYGGEEFLVVCPDSDLETTAMIAGRLLTGLEGTEVELPDAILNLSASFGVIACEGASLLDADSLLRGADDALYRAKRGGRGQVVTAVPEEWLTARKEPGDCPPSWGGSLLSSPANPRILLAQKPLQRHPRSSAPAL